ncbi:MAG TPA: pilus assembly protein PilM [Microbacterium sp.]|uniref:type IV pilus biogenesis protein PilM n=1 Tax=Microbacterium sp. TaxID=51671 RepID=UPI002CB3DD55|nr:pilus assembly protein PilM [Microbacterium sp.]HWI32483.1 pilus assembly protein PilM [Microbacterium sp.]
MARTVVGLEITEESVRAAEVTIGRAPALVAYGEVPLPPGAAKDSEVLDADAVALALRQLWSRTGIKGKRVVLGLGNRRILVREYTTRALKPEQLRQALPFQVQDILPVPVDQAVLDFYEIDRGPLEVSGLLVAAVSETVEQLIATLSKAKIVADTVDLVPFGLARAVRALASPGETVAMVSIGDHTSYVVVTVDGAPRFVRIIPIDVSTAATRAREGEGEAEQIEERVLETVPPQPVRGRAALRSASAPDALVVDLVARLRSTLDFYGNRPGAAPVTTVFLTGAGTAVSGVMPALMDALGVDVRVVLPTDLVSSKHPPLGDLGLNLVSTIGLALGQDR